MIRKGIRAPVRPALDLPADGAFRRVYPFRRNWIAIAVMAVFDAVFTIPAVTVFSQAAKSWGRLDGLFDLVAALFSSAWLLGWSIAPISLTAILLLMLFGRETVRIEAGRLRVFLGMPWVGVAAEYELAGIRNLRLEQPPKKSGKSWRGRHLAFDYGANTMAFGSDVDERELERVRRAIEIELGRPVRVGEAAPEELAGQWKTARDHSPDEPAAVQSSGPAGPPVHWSSPSALMLIAANLVPVAGAVWLGWELGDVMVLYWAESAIIGFYNLCKMAVIDRWLALLTGTFFVGHFGAFMAVHFLFIWGIFVKGFDATGSDELAEVARHFVGLWPALAALFVSHGISFFTNFIGRREYRGRSGKDQMAEPYSRIVLMHVTLIFGGGLALVLGSPTYVILVVIVAKIVLDVRAHLRERKKFSGAAD